MRKKCIFIVAAGSGGHILPGLQIAQQWHQTNPRGMVYFFTGTSNLEKKIIQQHAFIPETYYWHLSKFSLRRWWTLPLVILQGIYLIGKSFFYVTWHKPEMVISTGGILSLPLCYAAWILRSPIELYELNVVPGKAIKALMPCATTIYTVFAQTKTYCRWWLINFSDKVKLISYPLRFTQKDKELNKQDIVKELNVLLQQRFMSLQFTLTRKTIFVLGGSQGSRLLNILIKNFFQKYPEAADHIQVIHQVGAFEEQEWDNWYMTHRIPAFTFGYDAHIQRYYTLADLVICRAGAGTLFEIAFFEKQCLLIPLITTTTSHQNDNAYAMATMYPQLFTVIEQSIIEKDQNIFANTINQLL